MPRFPSLSVVATTYNWPAALDRVLDSLAGQTLPDFEIVVADDGSGPETRALVDGWRGRLGERLKHVWQEDQGFRAGRVRNLGARAATGD